MVPPIAAAAATPEPLMAPNSMLATTLVSARAPGILPLKEAEGEVESQTRLENIEELVNKAVSYEEDSEHPSLDEFLEQVALVADIDNMDESENRFVM